MSISKHRNIPSTAPHQASRDPQGHVRNKSRFANPFKDSHDQPDQIPSIRPVKNPSIALKLEPQQSFKKALKSLGEFSQFSTPLSSPSRNKDLPFLSSDQTPTRARAMTSHSNINTYYAGSVNALPCPSLTNVLESLSKKSSDRPNNGLAGSINSTGSNNIYKLTTLGGKMRGYSFKSHFGHHKNNISNSSDSFSQNQPSIEEDFVQRSHRASSENKNIFAKPSVTPSKGFLSPKSMSTRNFFASASSANGLFTKDRIQQEHQKKASMFDFMKDKADQQVQTQYPKIVRDKRSKWKVPLSVQSVNPLFEPPKAPKIILKSYNDDMYVFNPPERPMTQANPLKNEMQDPVQTAISTPLTTRKRDIKVTMKYNCNFTMAKIEKQALKELKAKRNQRKLLVKFERPQVREDLDHSPLKARPNKFGHPLFDTDEIEIPNEERMKRLSERKLNPGGFEARILRRKLIHCLNKMRRLKINPKDLLKCEKIFSTVPFEKEGSKKLIAAAKCGDKETVLELLDKKNRYLVYDFDQTHQTALHWATRKGNEEIVEILIAKGSDVNAKDISGRTALFHALKGNHILVVKHLLANQADPWSNKDCNYMELAKNNPTVKHYLSKAKQLHILIKMTPPYMRDIMWEKEGVRLIVNMNFNIDNLKVYPNPQ